MANSIQNSVRALLNNKFDLLIAKAQSKRYSKDLRTATHGIDGMEWAEPVIAEMKTLLVKELTREERLDQDVRKRFNTRLGVTSRAINNFLKDLRKKGQELLDPQLLVNMQDLPIVFEQELPTITKIISVDTLMGVEQQEEIVTPARIIHVHVPYGYTTKSDWLLFGNTAQRSKDEMDTAYESLISIADSHRETIGIYDSLGDLLKARIAAKEKLVLRTPEHRASVNRHEFYQSEVWLMICTQIQELSGGQCERVVDGIRCSQSHQETHHLTYFRFGGDELLTDLLGVCRECHPILDIERRKNENAHRAKHTRR